MRASGVMPRLRRFGLAHQHGGGRTVVEARGVAGRHRAFLVEGGRSLAMPSSVAPARIYSSRIDDDVALAALDREGDDLVLEAAGLLRGLGLVLRGDGERVLLVAGQLPLRGDVLGRVAHVVAVEGVGQAVLDHGVDHLQVAHLDAAAQMRAMRRHRHRFLAAGDDDLSRRRVAICCMPSATARRPEPQSWLRPQAVASLRHAGLHRRLARRVLALAGRQDLAEDHLVDLGRIDAGALERPP